MLTTAVLTVALALSAASSPAFAAKGPKPEPTPTASAAVATVPTVQYNINKNVDPLNTWQVNNPTAQYITATLEITNDETLAVTSSTFSVSPASAWGGKNIVQPTPRNPGETATLIVNGVRLNTATASDWDSLFQSWEDPKLGYINIVTGETAPRPTN